MLTTLTLLATLACSCVQAQTAQPIVDLGYAQYQGSVDPGNGSGSITNFLGIRYAAAPLGDLRFRAPRPPANVSGVQQATTQPNQCFQASDGVAATNPLRGRAAEAVASSEDCLFLNVHHPSDAAGKPIPNLPVIVWIHGMWTIFLHAPKYIDLFLMLGGGYLAGSANANGEDLIRQSNQGIVAVIIQYRLGVFGFLPGTEVKKNGALNAGLLDQDFALRWVNQHISKFGGDPSKVTIWGESAGAGSVLQHLIANNGQTKPQLFRGAISSSSFLPSQYRFDDRIPEILFSQVVAQSNCTASSDAMACLRAADATVLETANTNINNAGFFGTFVVIPVIDGTFITQSPTRALLEGRVNGEALLAVTNTFEGTVFVNQNTTLTAAQYAFELFPDFGQAQAAEAGAQYAGLGTSLFQDNAIQGESIFICPTYSLLRAFPGRSFKGEFAIPPGLHGNDVVYYFPGTSTPPFNNTAFINAFAQAFTSFAISLDPNVKVDPATITPHWNVWDNRNTEMLFNRTEAGQPVVHPITTSNALLGRCGFWDSVSNLTAQ
ncbi:Alpha/Beta hydrolase protein [Mycena crocata]|nr:Alpha/Beta hydrolase protein [Mycena crocata]